MYRVALSNQADKKIKSGLLSEDALFDLLDSFLDSIKGIDTTLDVIKLSGKWKGCHRIRYGKLRIVIKADFSKNYILVKKIGTRGDVYR